MSELQTGAKAKASTGFTVFAESYLEYLGEAKKAGAKKAGAKKAGAKKAGATKRFYVNSELIETQIDDYINNQIDVLADLIKKQSKYNINDGHVDFLRIQKLKLEKYREDIHKKTSIIEKTNDIYHEYVRSYKDLLNTFKNLKQDIKGRSESEITEIVNRFKKNLPKLFNTWNMEKGWRDLAGHNTQPSKVVLTNLLNKGLKLDLPITYTSSTGDEGTDQLFINKKLNPVFPFRYLMNLVAFKALNNVSSSMNKKTKEWLNNTIGNAILGRGLVRDEIINYVQNNENFRKRLPYKDFNEFIKTPMYDLIDKKQGNQAQKIEKDKRSLFSGLMDDDDDREFDIFGNEVPRHPDAVYGDDDGGFEKFYDEDGDDW